MMCSGNRLEQLHSPSLNFRLCHSCLCSLVDKPPAFAFEAGKRHRRYAADVDLEAEFELQLLSDSCRLLQMVFDLNGEFVHRAVFVSGDSILDDLRKTVEDLLE